MSRLSQNYNLTKFAGFAGELRFDDSVRPQFDELESARLSFRNCYRGPSYRWWAIKQYIAGSQRTLGVFKPEHKYHATRYADLCIVRFWKYRKTDRPVRDSDLNYSVSLANTTLADCPAAVDSLDKIEIFLQQRFGIQSHCQPELSASSALKLFVRDWGRFASSAANLRALTPPCANTRIAFDMLTEHVGQLSAVVRSLELAVPPAPKPEAQTAKRETNDVVIGPDGAAQPELHSLDHTQIPPLFSK